MAMSRTETKVCRFRPSVPPTTVRGDTGEGRKSGVSRLLLADIRRPASPSLRPEKHHRSTWHDSPLDVVPHRETTAWRNPVMASECLTGTGNHKARFRLMISSQPARLSFGRGPVRGATTTLVQLTASTSDRGPRRYNVLKHKQMAYSRTPNGERMGRFGSRASQACQAARESCPTLANLAPHSPSSNGSRRRSLSGRRTRC